MNDIVDSARSARQKLATALGLLQAPETIAFLDTVASPVARAMGALHRIESTNGDALAEGGPAALAAVREALGALQSVPEGNATLDQASEQVAGSLGLVHALAQRASALAAAAPTAAPPVVAAAPVATTPASVPPQAGFTKTAPSVAPEAPRPQFAKTTPSVTPEAEGHVHVSQPPVGAFDKTAMASQSPVAHLEIPKSPSQSPPPGLGHTQETPPFQAAAAAQQAAAAQHAAPQHQHAAPQATAVSPAVAQQRPQSVAPAHDAHPVDSKHAPAPSEVPNTGTPVIEANLGAHSPTNFYKGLSGNDVIADGGLFVATYNIPPLGSHIWLRVTLPGGYDFEASAEVRWTRESGVGDAPPGFGASLVSLSAEARQLIQRYVRNREPLFHDDL